MPCATSTSRAWSLLGGLWFSVKPDELLDHEHPLYRRENIRANLESVLDLGDRHGVRISFTRADQLPDLLVPPGRIL